MTDEIIVYTNGELSDQSSSIELNKDKIISMLDEGYASQDISALLKLDLIQLQAFVTTYNREKWKYMTRGEVLQEHLTSLNEMIDVAKSQYMHMALPPAAQAVALLIQTALSVSDALDNKEDPAEKKRIVLEQVIQPFIEETISRMTKDMSRIRGQILEITPIDRQSYVTEQINSIMTTMGDTMKDTYKAAEKTLDGIFKNKKKPTQVNALIKPLMVQK